MVRLALHHLVAVGERALEITGEKIRGGALVPTLGVCRLAADHGGVDGDRLFELPRRHRLVALRHQHVDGRVARAPPQSPHRLFRKVANLWIVVGKARTEYAVVGSGAVARNPDYGVGAPVRGRVRQRLDGLGAVGIGARLRRRNRSQKQHQQHQNDSPHGRIPSLRAMDQTSVGAIVDSQDGANSSLMRIRISVRAGPRSRSERHHHQAISGSPLRAYWKLNRRRAMEAPG